MSPTAELTDDQAVEQMRGAHRPSMLPGLFKFRGKPYSLEDYPQFETFYPNVYPPYMIWMTGRQTGKSINLSRSEVIDCISIPYFQILYVAPLQLQTQRYSREQLKDAIATCPQALQMQERDEAIGATGRSVVRTVGYQSFSNGSSIQLTYAKTSSDRARGIMADRIDFDEVQDQLSAHMAVVEESLTQSEWGHRRYTGTAKTTDNIIEQLWQGSSMGEWATKCPKCNYWNIPNRDGRVLDMIKAAGPSCIRCRTVLPVREGQWVHAHPNRVKEFVGYHIPKIVVPAIVYNPKKWGELIRKVLHSSPTTIYNELLGIASDEGLKPITQADVDKASDLGTHAELLAHHRNYPWVVIGVDWGVAEVKSFTVAAAVAITTSGKLHVLFAKRYFGMDYDKVTNDIAAMAKLYDAWMIAGDYGVGFVHNQRLNRLGCRVGQFQYLAQNHLVSFLNNAGQVPHWTVDRNTALTVMFWLIKSGQIHFARKEESANYTADLLSPYEQVVESSSGIGRKKFLRNPNLPDDFAHALTFAMLALCMLTGNDLMDVIPEGSFAGAPFEDTPAMDIKDIMAGKAD